MCGMAYQPSNALIPRSLLFGNPLRVQAQISPDGRFISYLAPLDGVLNVWVAPRGDLAAASPITNDRKRGLQFHSWAYSGRHVLYIQDEAGDENWRLYCVDVETREQNNLTPFEGVQAQLVGLSPRHPHTVLVGLNDRKPEWHDLHKVDLHSGTRQLVELNDSEFAGYIVDMDLTPRLAVKLLTDGGGEILRRTQAGWQSLLTYGHADSLTTQPLTVEGGGDTALLISAVGRDKAALVRVHLESGRQSEIGASEKADISDVWIHPQTHAPEAYAVEYLERELFALTPAAEKDIQRLRDAFGPRFHVTGTTVDFQTWVVAVDDPTRSLAYHLYERTTGETTFLFEQNPQLADMPLQPMSMHEIRSRDGLALTAYLTVPDQASGPVPMVLNVHGGPWARDSYGFDREHQWLANRGYAVLSVNFRGSTGFGKSFVNAGDREWAGKMHTDLLDAADWAVARGITEPDKIAIYGGSYGGYAALVGLTFTPERFACAVDIVGPSNLVTLIESIPPYWKSFYDDMTRRIGGDPRTPEGRAFLLERSPLTLVDRIARPLLIGQGANDPRVKQAESDQIVRAMRDKGLPVTYAVYPDEGHGFVRPENRLSFHAIAEAFLARHLGGRYQPVGNDFEGSSVHIGEGLNEIPGLPESLPHPRT
jgi:dipeptidyl aminopeptidase/acylaminoacyl peptidase